LGLLLLPNGPRERKQTGRAISELQLKNMFKVDFKKIVMIELTPRTRGRKNRRKTGGKDPTTEGKVRRRRGNRRNR